MKTYKTIQQAFSSGTGDCFFSKQNEFIAVSRKNNSKHNELLENGFKFMQHDEVRNEALRTEPKVEPKVLVIKQQPLKDIVPARKRGNFNNSDIY